MSARRIPALLRRGGRSPVVSGAAPPVIATGTSGFSDTSTGSYYGRSDTGAALQAASNMSIAVMFRYDAAGVGAIRRLFSKNTGATGWSIFLSTTDAIQYRDSGSATLSGYTFTAADVGKTFIVLAARDNTAGSRLWAYRVADDSAVLLDRDTTVAAPATTTNSVAIGAQRGDSVGGLEAVGITIIACAWSSTSLSDAQALAYLQEAAAAGTLPVTMPGAVSVYQSPALETDLVGTNHLTEVTAGGALTEVTFTPEYREGLARVIMLLGQSNARGNNTLASVPDYSGTGGINYTLSYADVRLWSNTGLWGALRPIGNNDWASELAFGRQIDTDGEPVPFYVFKYALSGTDLAVDWLPPSGSMYTGMLTQFQAAFYEQIGTARAQNPFFIPSVFAIVWTHGEADALSLADANAYEANLGTLIDALRTDLPIAADFLWIDTRLATFMTLTYRTTVNAAKDAVSAARSAYMVQVDTDALTSGDALHYDPDSQIQLGLAVAEAWLTRADVVANAP